ncbi:MAG: DUF1501 domain-containing protein [Anaerolineae bacterium]|nr:DUF1501 domain-containing protein [Anaerolineae bacterium]
MKTVRVNRLTSRREALGMIGAAGVIGLSKGLFPSWMPRLAFRRSGAPGDILVVIFLRGGMDGLNAVVPYAEGAAYYDARPTIAIAEPSRDPHSAIDLNGFFGLHPALRPLKALYDDGALAIIHACGSPDPTRSHFDAMEYMERGTPGSKTTRTGWLSRHLESAAWQNDSPFRAVGIGTMLPSSLRGEVSALALKSIADFHLGGREDQLEAMRQALARLYTVESDQPLGRSLLAAYAKETFAVMDILANLNVGTYVPERDAKYPESEFGEGLKQIAVLIKAEVGLEVACLDLGGWDTHEEQGGAEGEQARLLAELAEGLAAFYADMGERMSGVSVVVMSEFGRRVAENASHGTDHGHGNAMFVLGGGVIGGVYADWRGLGASALVDGDLPITTDYRDVLASVLAERVLNPALDYIFPNYTPKRLPIVRPR